MTNVVSDGCTGIPDGRFRDCCVAHDAAYTTHCWPDGTPCTREEADEALRD